MKATPTLIKAKKSYRLKQSMKQDIIAIMELMVKYAQIENTKQPSKNKS